MRVAGAAMGFTQLTKLPLHERAGIGGAISRLPSLRSGQAGGI